MHSADRVSKGVVIWDEPILFVSVADSFWSPKVLKFYNQCPERSGISTICCQSVFRKTIEKYLEDVSKFSSCYSKLCFDFFYFDDVTNAKETTSLIGFPQ